MRFALCFLTIGSQFYSKNVFFFYVSRYVTLTKINNIKKKRKKDERKEKGVGVSLLKGIEVQI